MGERVHVRRVDARLVAGFLDALHDADALVVRARNLRRHEFVVGQEEDDVGERPADVDADAR